MIEIILKQIQENYNISYKIFSKDCYKNSPSFYAYEYKDKIISFNLSKSTISKEDFSKLLNVLFNTIEYVISDTKKDSDYELTHDVLTKVYNRAYFTTVCKECNNIDNIVVISGDVNNLKIMNDVFGHIAGDNLLIATASILSEYANKKNYMIFRCGGDEFNIVIKGECIDGVHNYCEKVQNACKNYKGNLILNPSISLGVAVKELNENIEDTFKRADSLMYKDKLKIKSEMNIITDLEEKLNSKDNLFKKSLQDRINLATSFALYKDMSLSALADLIQAIKIQRIGAILFRELDNGNSEKVADIGYRLAKLDDSTLRIAKTIHQCHENYNGSGYLRLQGDKIDYLARIIRLINFYIENKEKDLYKNNQNKLLSIMSKMSIFDPKLVRDFVSYINMISKRKENLYE